jgi:hypothetical protein
MYKPAFFLTMILTANSSFAVGAPETMSRQAFDQLMQDISNWGRWGDDDELGTLNLITEKKRKSAARLVKKGISV